MQRRPRTRADTSRYPLQCEVKQQLPRRNAVRYTGAEWARQGIAVRMQNGSSIIDTFPEGQSVELSQKGLGRYRSPGAWDVARVVFEHLSQESVLFHILRQPPRCVHQLPPALAIHRWVHGLFGPEAHAQTIKSIRRKRKLNGRQEENVYASETCTSSVPASPSGRVVGGYSPSISACADWIVLSKSVDRTRICFLSYLRE